MMNGVDRLPVTVLKTPNYLYLLLRKKPTCNICSNTEFVSIRVRIPGCVTMKHILCNI